MRALDEVRSFLPTAETVHDPDVVLDTFTASVAGSEVCLSKVTGRWRCNVTVPGTRVGAQASDFSSAWGAFSAARATLRAKAGALLLASQTLDNFSCSTVAGEEG